MTDKLFSALEKLVAWLCQQSTETVLLVCILAVNVIGGTVTVKYAIPSALMQVQGGYDRIEKQQTQQIESITKQQSHQIESITSFMRDAMRRGAFIVPPHQLDNVGAMPRRNAEVLQ